MPIVPSTLERYRGCLLGLACGDAVGTTVEFSPRGSFPPVTDMVGGGPFDLDPGVWTDDTSMALCLANSLLHCKGFNARDQMNRYVNWWQWGYMSATGECFDIGWTVCRALQRFQVNGDPFAGSTEPDTAGNGSLMRLAPVVMAFAPNRQAVLQFARLSSQTTHAAEEALDSCELFAEILRQALHGADKAHLLAPIEATYVSQKVQNLAQGNYPSKPAAEVRGTGYCVESLEAALWCFAHTSSFEQAVLAAVNLGDDADTTAAIVGQLAGAHYGARGIPPAWLQRLHMYTEIDRLAAALFAFADAPGPDERFSVGL